MPTTRFTIPGALSARLANLHLATDQVMTQTPLTHIACSLRGNELRFAATDGKILALLRTEVLERSGDESLDLIIDAAQFTDAVKAQARMKAKTLTALIDTGAKELRLGSQYSAGIITLREGVFPRIDGLLTKYQGGTWWPSLATYDQRYLAVLQKITGKASPLLRSIAMEGNLLKPIWSTVRPSGDHGDVTTSIPTTAISQMVCAPGWYTDHELLILIMPINRPEEGGEATFNDFLLTSRAALPTSIAA